MKKVSNNLDPQAQRWVRNVEDSISNLEKLTAGLAESDRQNAVVVGGVTQAVAAIKAQQDALQAQQVQLSDQQVQLSDQQDALQAQQVQLSDQQDQIVGVVNAIPITRMYSNTATGFSIPSGENTRGTVTVPWESGKSQVAVYAIGVSQFTGNVSQAQLASWRVRIGGTDGPWGSTQYFKMDDYSSVAVSSRSFSSSSSFSVDFRVNAGANHGTHSTNSAQLHVIAVFS